MPFPDLVPEVTKPDPRWWITAAQAAVRRYAGWHIAPSISDTLTVDGYGGSALLIPSQHVTKLAKVMIGERDVTERVYFSQAGTLVLTGGQWPDLPGSVTVELEHGYDPDEVPEIAALILAVGKRARSDPGVVSSQSVNGASVSYQTAGGAPLGISLLDIEKQALAPYKLTWGAK